MFDNSLMSADTEAMLKHSKFDTKQREYTSPIPTLRAITAAYLEDRPDGKCNA